MASLCLTAAVPGPSLHLALRRSVPGKDSVLAVAPTAITLWFTARPEMAVTTVSLLDASAARIDLAKPRLDAADETEVIADVRGQLRPGIYRVVWKTSSHDGHAIRGEFSFALKPTAN